MTALIVIASILAFFALIFLLLFLLTAKIRFRFDTDTGVFGMSAKAFLFNINILPVNEKKKQKKDLKQARRLAKKIQKGKNGKDHLFVKNKKIREAESLLAEMQKNADTASDKKKTFSEKIDSFKSLLTNICEKIKIIVPGTYNALSLDIKKLDIVVGAGDAAKTAISYGIVCAAVEGLYAVGKRSGKLKVGNKVFVGCDYLGESFRCEFDIVLKVRVFRLLPVLRAFL